MSIQKILENRPLFKECVESLKAEILPLRESDDMITLFEIMFPLTTVGCAKIDWNRIDKKIYLGTNPDLIIPALNELFQRSIDREVYIFWGDAAPIIKTNLDAIINFFDDVTCVSFEKFIFNPTLGYMVEIRASDEITVGLVKPYDQIIEVVDAEFMQDTRDFLKEAASIPIKNILPKISLIERKINRILLKIKQCDKDYEAATYFELLEQFKDILKKIQYKERVDLPDNLRKFIKIFNRIDMPSLREKIFDQLKKGELDCFLSEK